MQATLRRVAVAMLLVSAIPTEARATVLMELSIEDMAAEASAVVLGRVVETRTYLSREAGSAGLYTAATIAVEQWVKGQGPTRIDLHERGGISATGGTAVVGAPVYRTGDRVLVFVRVDALGRARTLGMVQGRFEVRPSPGGAPSLAVRDLGSVALARLGPNGVVLDHAGPMSLSLDELLERIVSVVDDLGATTRGGGALR